MTISPLLGSLLLLAAWTGAGGADEGWEADSSPVSPMDHFHPDRDPSVVPSKGGRVIVHIPSEPPNLCYPIENSSVTRWCLYEMHEFLLRQNWETYEYEPVLAEEFWTEDTVVLAGGRGGEDGTDNIVFGHVTDVGDAYEVIGGSPYHEMEPRRIPKEDVESVQKGTVFTFRLHDGVRWHDGHRLDADDLVFSWDIYNNEHVDCNQIRFRFEEILDAEALDERTARFFYRTQYFQALNTFGEDFCILPRHLYDLLDPDNPDHDPDATPQERGAYVNDNPRNIEWVGLGAYRLSEWVPGQYIEAERWDGYFDPADGGYLDTIRWRLVENDDAAFEALLNGEIDVFSRVKTEDYFGEKTETELFTENFYKAYTYTASYNYSAWNMRRSKFADQRVRQAFQYAFDGEEWVRTKYHGLAKRVTGPQFYFGPGYNHDVTPDPYDPFRAEELLAEAGWYDRDGDGIVDRDGEPMVIEYLMPSGNKASEAFIQKLQESYGQIGVKIEMVPLEWAQFLERILDHEFDVCGLAWTMSVESDPYQLWHSSTKDQRSSNHAGMDDEVVDELIERGRRELDPETRYGIWHELHARLYDLKPYLWREMPPRKYAINKDIRGVRLYKITPGYKLREWFYPGVDPR